MSAPKILIQIVITATQIFGKALFEAGKQAVKNAKSVPEGAIGSDVSGVRNATSGSVTDKLTREHRMTLDEAQLILNIKRGEVLENVLKNYEHLFKQNSPPAPKATTTGKPIIPPHSHYLQSKVVRARERIEAELKVLDEGTGSDIPKPGAGSNPPPPPGASGSSAS